MRTIILTGAIMATFFGPPAALGQQYNDVPKKPNALQQKAPAGPNTLRDKMNELYWRESQGLITQEQADQEWAIANKKASKEEIEMWNNHIDNILHDKAD